MTKTSPQPADHLAQTTQAALELADCYRDAFQSCVLAGAEAFFECAMSPAQVASMKPDDQVDRQPGGRAADSSSDRSDLKCASRAPAAKSWYRPPVENPMLAIIDDALRPWRTFVPDPRGGAGNTAFWGANEATDIMAIYQGNTGHAVGTIAFPDDEHITVTLPAPWAYWNTFAK